jgi:hypothetical protein
MADTGPERQPPDLMAEMRALGGLLGASAESPGPVVSPAGSENGLTAEPWICGQVVGYGLGDRYSNTYCDWLPDGHEGACEVRPLAGRMAEAWSVVSPQPPDGLRARIEALCDQAERAEMSRGVVMSDQIRAVLAVPASVGVSEPPNPDDVQGGAI